MNIYIEANGEITPSSSNQQQQPQNPPAASQQLQNQGQQNQGQITPSPAIQPDQDQMNQSRAKEIIHSLYTVDEVYNQIKAYTINDLSDISSKLDNLNNMNKQFIDEDSKLKSNSIVRDVASTLVKQVNILNNLIRNKNDVIKCIEFDTRINIPINGISTLCQEGQNIINSINNFKV